MSSDAEQEERREYVKNIGIEYRFGCYEEKRADSCHLLGEYAEAVEQQFERALSLFRENCEQRNYAKSCYKLGLYMLAGKVPNVRMPDLQKPFEVACQENIPPGCRYLALTHWNEKPPNPEAAQQFMQKACELEDAEACWLLSTWHMGHEARFATQSKKGAKPSPPSTSTTTPTESGGVAALPRNMTEALRWGIRACDYNVPQSCANVSRMYRLGDGVERDLDKAKEYADKARDVLDTQKTSTEHVPDFTG